MTALALSPRTRDRLEEIVGDIAVGLQRPPKPFDGDTLAQIGLFGGWSGLALFYAYLDRVRPDPRWRRIGRRFIDKSVALVPQCSDRPFFAYGFSGTAWAIQHLAGWFLEPEADALVEIDEGLRLLVEDAAVVSVDLQYGLAGFGTYALERLPEPGAARLLSAIVRRLARMAEHHARGVTWKVVNAKWVETHLLPSLYRGVYWPNVHNGVAGVVGVLGGAIRAGIEVELAEPLLDGAFAWLRSKRRMTAGSAGWANGALGIACVAYAAARAARRAEWEAWWLAEARRIIDSLPRVRDISFASGIAGVTHMCYRLYLATGDARFGDATRRCLDRLVRRRRDPDHGIAGFAAHSSAWQRKYMRIPDFPIGWVPVAGLTTGVAGVGLVLLELLDDRPPAWDRALLLSSV
jgi:hypothetical protein